MKARLVDLCRNGPDRFRFFLGFSLAHNYLLQILNFRAPRSFWFDLGTFLDLNKFLRAVRRLGFFNQYFVFVLLRIKKCLGLELEPVKGSSFRLQFLSLPLFPLVLIKGLLSSVNEQ